MEPPFAQAGQPKAATSEDGPSPFSSEWDRVAFLMLGAIVMLMGLQATGISQLSDGLVRGGDLVEASQGIEPAVTRVNVAFNWLCGYPGIFYFISLGVNVSGAMACPRQSTAGWVMSANMFLCIFGLGLCAYFTFGVFSDF
ncbi:hypothetical protein [Blastopirellula marina]|uniref:Uncharacterized protein n=1 Tax=Blastopirellula marina TaxID=124 RepID=A0A2S8GMI3_9BACT|nr:hypothetical protein [Blastopirellula marina]PQO45643.1 hypothetical protein C5Y93_14505 [Blastopirellula marina]